MQLFAISYTSTAISIPTQREFDDLLNRSKAVNAQHDVTGVLVYAEGRFHQYIEGPHAGLATVYARILRAPLHQDIFELINEPIEQREFSNWTMGFRIAGRPAQECALDQLIEDDGRSLSAGRLLLTAFWEKVHPRR